MNRPRAGYLSPLVFNAFALLLCGFIRFALSTATAEPAPQLAYIINTTQMPGTIWPKALAVDSSGNIYVSSHSAYVSFPSVVAKLARNGDYLNELGSSGPGPGQFVFPGPVAFDVVGNIYVSDGIRIEKFDIAGQFLIQWGSSGTDPGQLNGANGMAINGAGQVYIADSNNHRIQMFTTNGVFLGGFGYEGAGAGQFASPLFVNIDSSNTVYVTDRLPSGTSDFRVQKFDAAGNFLSQWAPYGTNDQTSIEPQGVAMDYAKNIYVTDSVNNRVVKFSSDGVLLAEWGSYGNGPGQFSSVTGIAVDASGNYVYVADYENRRIQVFAYSALEPIVYQSPTNQTVPAGVNVRLDVSAFGAQPLAYQWRFGNIELLGKTNASMTISNASLSDSGNYSALASNQFGTAQSGTATITVLPIVITTLPVSSITTSGAVLNGRVVLGVNPSSAWFEWGTDTNYGSVVGRTNLNANASAALSQQLTNLNSALIYHYRLVGSNALGIVYGDDIPFQVGLAPQVTTLPTSLTTNGAISFGATVNPNARPTTVWFTWSHGTAPNLDSITNTPSIQIGGGITPVTVQAQVQATNLHPGFIYSVQAVASNAVGVVSGNYVRFKAPPGVLLPVPAGQYWTSLAMSADGKRLAGSSGRLVGSSGTGVWLSSDAGTTWTNILPSSSYSVVSMSADGKRMVAAFNSGATYYSTNFGITWFIDQPARYLGALASSGDGLAVAATAGYVLTSTNGGKTWSTNSPPVNDGFNAIASSADGKTLIVASGPNTGALFSSTNAGLSWTSNNLPKTHWGSVAASADGKTFAATTTPGYIYVSTNAGAFWWISGVPYTNWGAIAISADGTKIAACTDENYDGMVYTSTNSGLTWQSELVLPLPPFKLVSSADGARLFFSSRGEIAMLQTTPTPQLDTTLVNHRISLSWIIPSEPFVLQQALNLSPPQWTDVTNSPVLIFTNLHSQVTMPATNPASYYRLRSQ